MHNLIQHIKHGEEVETSLIVGRIGTSNKEKMWPVDVLFPQKLKGEVDVASVDEGFALFLEGLVRAIQPQVVLETGTHKGRSVRAIAKALQDNGSGHVYTIDMDDYGLRISGAIEGLEDRVTQIVGKTPDIFGCQLLSKLQGIDFAYIDGDHTYEGLLADLNYVEEHCVDGCIVVVDNSLDEMWHGVRKCLDDYKFKGVVLPTMCGADILKIKK